MSYLGPALGHAQHLDPGQEARLDHAQPLDQGDLKTLPEITKINVTLKKYACVIIGASYSGCRQKVAVRICSSDWLSRVLYRSFAFHGFHLFETVNQSFQDD